MALAVELDHVISVVIDLDWNLSQGMIVSTQIVDYENVSFQLQNGNNQEHIARFISLVS